MYIYIDMIYIYIYIVNTGIPDVMGVLRRHEALLFGHTEWMESWHPSRGADD